MKLQSLSMDKRPAKLRPWRTEESVTCYTCFDSGPRFFIPFQQGRDAEVLKSLRGIGGDSETLTIKTTKAQNWSSPI